MLKVIFGIGITVLVFQNVGTSVLQCGTFQSQENLNMDKMLGRWNIVGDNARNKKDLKTCFFFNLQKNEPDSFSFDFCGDQNILILHCIYNFTIITRSDKLSNTYTAKIYNKITNSTTLGEFYVRETDYDNYAVFHFQKCPENLIIIVSRHYVLNEEEIDKLTKKYFDEKVTYVNSFKNCDKNITTPKWANGRIME